MCGAFMCGAFSQGDFCFTGLYNTAAVYMWYAYVSCVWSVLFFCFFFNLVGRVVQRWLSKDGCCGWLATGDANKEQGEQGTCKPAMHCHAGPQLAL